MKKVVLIISSFFSIYSFAQTHTDSVRLLQKTVALYDLDYTQAEADSMLENAKDMQETYKAMHKTLPPNSLPYPFAFEPAPFGFKIPQHQQPIEWNVPPHVNLPAKESDLAFYSLPQIGALLRQHKITSVKLTEFFLARLKQWGDTLHCVITLTEDLAMQQARQADADFKNGIIHSPLQGIPYGLKDLFAVKGYKTTWGSTPYKDQEIKEDAFVYTQLRKAGAVLCAKLSLGALAYGDLWFGGRTNDPWDLTLGSSGSSAGSASSVVAGLLPFAIGTETLGSIVSPSTRCGATGLRPTFGTVSRNGAMVLCWSLDKIGPICRSAEDAALVYSSIKGTDGKDIDARDHAFNFNPNTNIKKLRIAYARNYFSRLPKDGIEWRVVKTFQSMGVNPVAVDFPDSSVYNFNMTGVILDAEAAAAFDELTRTNRDDLIERQDKNFWPNEFRASRIIPAVEYINANRYRSALCNAIQSFMKDYDVVIVPTYAGHQLSITNLTGNPVVCLPAGFSEKGLPVSITFVGNLYDEASILAAAKAFQENTDYNKKHPPLFQK